MIDLLPICLQARNFIQYKLRYVSESTAGGIFFPVFIALCTVYTPGPV